MADGGVLRDLDHVHLVEPEQAAHGRGDGLEQLVAGGVAERYVGQPAKLADYLPLVPLHAPGLSAQNWSNPWSGLVPPVFWEGVAVAVGAVPPVVPAPLLGVAVAVAPVDVPELVVPPVVVGVGVALAPAVGVRVATAPPVSCGSDNAGGGDLTSV